VPSPSPSPEPSPEPSPSPAVEQPSPAPEPSPSPEAETHSGDASILEKIGTFQDIEDIDLSTLLKVTAGEGGARTPDDEPGVWTLVTEEDIRRSGARTVAEVLETVAGFEVLYDRLGRGRIVVRGIPAGLAGGGSENVLVLLNGLRLNENLTGGATAVNLDIPVDNVKRIEITRGPGPVVHGPGAFLGVINIVTESVDTFRRDELTMGGGSFGTFQYNFRYGTTFKDVSLAGFMQFARTGGTGLEIPEDLQTATDRQLAPLGIPAASLAPGEVEDDGRAVDANITVAWRELTLNTRIKKEEIGAFVGLLDTLGRQNRLSNQQVTADLEWRRGVGYGEARVKAGFSQSRIASFLDAFPPGFTIVAGTTQFVFPNGVLFHQRLNTRRFGAEAALDRSFGAQHTVTGGVAVERESTYDLDARSNLDFFRQEPRDFGPIPAIVPEADRTILSAYLQDAWNPSRKLGVTGGVRVDHYSDFDTAVTPRLATVWRVHPSLNLKASYGRAVRTPSFVERFYSTPLVLAAPGLDSSRIDAFDVAVLFRRKDFRLSATAYQTAARDVVVDPGRFPLPVGGVSIPSYAQIEGIDARGLEVEAARSFAGNRSVSLVYTLQSAEDTTSGERLPGIPRHLARLSANAAVGRYFVVSPALMLRGERPRVLADTRAPVEGYALFDLTVRALNFHPRLEFAGVVHDLFDARYFDPSPAGALPGDYPRPGRSVFVKLKYRF
jgi:iron complex outermembrane receptor protein